VLDFTDGVEVTEIVGTLPGELQELLVDVPGSGVSPSSRQGA
jgi:hypothetical protein